MKNRILTSMVAVSLVIAGGQVAGCSKIRGTAGGPQRAVEVRVLFTQATLGLDKQLRIGDKVRVKETGSDVGSIASVTTTATMQAIATADGRLVMSKVPDVEDIVVTINGTAAATEEAYRFDGERIFVNQEVKFITPLVSFPGVVLSIRETGQ